MFQLFKRKKQVKIFSPCSGRIIPISEVKDPIFSQKILGEGFAVIPEEQIIYAPLAGQVTTIFPTKHAISIKSDSGIDYLIHIGIDTVELQGKPFSVLVNENDQIAVDTPLVEVDFNQIVQAEKDPSVIVVFTESEQNNELVVNAGTMIHGEVCGSIKGL